MTARPQDVALLPLPELPVPHGGMTGDYWTDDQIEEYATDYARANVTAALASAQAREDELRAEVERLRQMTCKCVENNARMSAAEVRADQLGQAAARLADSLSPGLPLNKKARRAIAEIRALSTNAATQTGETT